MECLYTFEVTETPKAMRRGIWYVCFHNRRILLTSFFWLAYLGYMCYILFRGIRWGSLLLIAIGGIAVIWGLVRFPLNPVSIHRLVRQEFRHMEPGEEQICYEFYDTYVILRNCTGYSRWEYRELHGLTLSGDKLYLMRAPLSLWVIPREVLPEGFLQFLLNAGLQMR